MGTKSYTICVTFCEDNIPILLSLYNEKENSIETEYRFQYPDDYYKFLLMHFVRLKPNKSKCRLCGRYFKTKTKKKNKYCGNTLGDGVTTCRVFAPKLFSKSDIEILFDKVNQRMYKRYERALSLEKKHSEKDLTYTQYCDWHDKAIKARNDCMDGIISFEQASKNHRCRIMQNRQEHHL